MRIPSSGLLSVLCLSALNAWALPGPPKVKESILPPRGWMKSGIPPADHNIVLRIGLPQPNFHLLEKHLYEVSDPYHDRYGAHLSKEETEALVAPHRDSLEAVNEWLESHNIYEADIVRSPAKDWVTITIPVSLAEKMLDTKYNVWKHSSGDEMVRTTSYSLPDNLHRHVDVVQPTTMFGRFKRDKSTIVWLDEEVEGASQKAQTLAATTITDASTGAEVDASCNATITIKCLQQLYNAVGFVPSVPKQNSIGITGYLEEFANLQDLQLFYADQRPDALNSSYKFVSVKGGLNNQTLSEAGVEAGLDVQFAFGLSHPIPATFYSTAGRPPFKPDVKTPTNTNEPYTDWLDFVLNQAHPPLSISTSYGDDEQTVPESFARRACQGFAQLGARGVSLMFSSGDGGVGDNDPNPATQQCFTNDGRNAFPDVSAQSDRYRIFLSGRPILIGGTSASSPAFAGFVALLNDVRLAHGKPSLGFLNPLLYSKAASGFNDITLGHNSGCGTTGFNATKGWDPVTGLGTPNFGKLKKLVL
ncbi:hypothetical protein H0H87_009339 [Tephrocybe sp. NHM501043]|nr:hypothetical protein H0H87_009339 [Tephrocybe sp. NHM501043]